MMEDEYGSPIGTGTFYLGPNPEDEKQARLYYSRGMVPVANERKFMVEDTNGNLIELTPELARTLIHVTEASILLGLKMGAIRVNDYSWLERRLRENQGESALREVEKRIHHNNRKKKEQ